MRVKLTFMAIATCLIANVFGQAISIGGVGNAVPPTQPVPGLSQFEVQGKLLTQNSIVNPTGTQVTGSFSTNARWNSMGNLTTANQTLNGFRTQTDGRALAWGHSIPNGGTVSNSFIEWIGNNSAGVVPGNLDFRFGTSPTSASSIPLFTMEPGSTGNFGHSYARNGLLGHLVSGSIGNFTSGNQWIGIGQPYTGSGTAITSIYGNLIQWDAETLIHALREDGVTPSIKNAITEWGTNTNSTYRMRFITGYNNPTDFNDIMWAYPNGEVRISARPDVAAPLNFTTFYVDGRADFPNATVGSAIYGLASQGRSQQIGLFGDASGSLRGLNKIVVYGIDEAGSGDYGGVL